MSVTLPTTPGPAASEEAVPTGPGAAEQLAPVVTLAERRAAPVHRDGDHGADAVTAGHDLAETGAASAEYAAVTACGVGLAGVLMKLLSSDFGQQLLETVLKFFLGLVGIG
jgi:hypothetical protein